MPRNSNNSVSGLLAEPASAQDMTGAPALATVIIRRLIQLLLAACILFFLVTGLAYLCFGWWPVTHEDLWQAYIAFVTTPWWRLALYKYNDHVVIFPNLLESIDIAWFQGRQLPLFVGGTILLLFTTALVLMCIWNDRQTTLETRLSATLAAIIGNLWMIRGEITASGEFNSGMSLVMSCVVLAIIVLPKTARSGRRGAAACFLVALMGFVAATSFAGALGIWPVLLFLAWRLRLPGQSMWTLVGAMLVTVGVFVLMPSAGPRPASIGSVSVFGQLPIVFRQLCELIGAPIAHSAIAWQGQEVSQQFSLAFRLAFWSGGVGAAIAVAFLVRQLIRRNLAPISIEYIGMGLILFGLLTCILIAVGRVNHFQAIPTETLAPRYLFWTTLFWAGLLIAIIGLGKSSDWLRWGSTAGAFAVFVYAIPSHYREGAHFKYVRIISAAGATSLINGVRDKPQVTILSTYQEDVFRAAEQLRTRRLDMFSTDLYTWVRQPAENIFADRQRARHFKGECRIDGLVPSNDGTPAARMTGWVSENSHSRPNVLVILDPQNVIRGIARTYRVNKTINRLLYRNTFPPHGLTGYIRDYDPQIKYSVRSADDLVLSAEAVIVQNAAN